MPHGFGARRAEQQPRRSSVEIFLLADSRRELPCADCQSAKQQATSLRYEPPTRHLEMGGRAASFSKAISQSAAIQRQAALAQVRSPYFHENEMRESCVLPRA